MSGITAEEAAGRMGVKVTTVYAYVSRGTLRSWRRPGSRTSLFDPEEVELLARRGRPRRTTRPAALDVVIETGLTVIGDHEVRYRGTSALELARTATFEEVAQWLWTGRREAPDLPWEAPRVAIPEVAGARDRLRLAVVMASAADPLRADLAVPAVVARGRSLVATLVAAVAAAGDARAPRLVLPAGGPPIRGTIAGRLWGRLAGARAVPGMVAALNAALVLLADHELAASTLAARVAASARADPYGVVLAGLGPLSGNLHGGASRLAGELLQAAGNVGPDAALARALETHQLLPGFGHRLYPEGDPRARLLLELVRSAVPGAIALGTVDRLIAAVRRRAQLEPNVDLALAVLAAVARMPFDAGETVFTVARTAGWIAHAIEEYGEAPLRFRARAAARR